MFSLKPASHSSKSISSMMNTDNTIKSQPQTINKKRSSPNLKMWSSRLGWVACMLLIISAFAINEISADIGNQLGHTPIEASTADSSEGPNQLNATVHEANIQASSNHPIASAKKHQHSSSRNHRNGSTRNGRQYDSAQSNYAGGQGADLSYANQLSAAAGSNYPAAGYGLPIESTHPGYPSMHSSSAYSGGNHPYYGAGAYGSSSLASTPSWSSSSSFPLMSSAFGISEIACVAVAVVIGAVILGGPFILLYLFMMNQMNGGMGSQGNGAVSLTGPTSSTTVNGRKKRQAGISKALFENLSPLINKEQVMSTFKTLMNSMAEYST